MGRKAKTESGGRFVIAITQSDGVVGELTGEGGKVIRFQTAEEANRAITRLYKDKRYSWNGVTMKCIEY